MTLLPLRYCNFAVKSFTMTLAMGIHILTRPLCVHKEKGAPQAERCDAHRLQKQKQMFVC